MAIARKDLPDVVRPFAWHGVQFEGYSGNDLYADCPFCGKVGKFYVDRESAQFVCASRATTCGRKGNAVTFLEQWYEHCLDDTTGRHRAKLAEARGGLPSAAFLGVAWDALNGRYVFPTRRETGTVQDLRSWKPKGKVLGTAGCKSGLFGLEQLLDEEKKEWPVFVCEGEWDAIVLRWLLGECKVHAIVTGVPGARVWKKEWTALLKGRDVTMMYDADEDGDEGSAKAALAIAPAARVVRFLCWPESIPDKFDVRDFVVARIVVGKKKPGMTWMLLRSMIQDAHRRPHLLETADAPAKIVRPESNITFQEAVASFRSRLDWNDDLEDALLAMYATVLSNQIPDDPVWLLLVGPPSSGKTKLISSLKDVPDVLFQSSVHTKALVSGFATKDGKDPCLIPKLLGKVGVFKDWTEVLKGNPMMVQELYSTLRGLYDGRLDRHYGNGQDLQYIGRFSIIGGTTNNIHGESQASVGERFLKFQLPNLSREQVNQRLWVAMTSVSMGEEHDAALAKASHDFLNRDVTFRPPIEMVGEEYLRRISAIAQLVSILRHEVEWGRRGFTEMLKFKPAAEVGARLAKQLVKLAMGVALVLDTPRLTVRGWRVVERTAFDTAIGFNLDLVQAMMELGGAGITLSELAKQARLPESNVEAKLADLVALDVVAADRPTASIGPGRPARRAWRVTRRVADLWRQANVQEDHVRSAAFGRVRKRFKKGETKE